VFRLTSDERQLEHRQGLGGRHPGATPSNSAEEVGAADPLWLRATCLLQRLAPRRRRRRHAIHIDALLHRAQHVQAEIEGRLRHGVLLRRRRRHTPQPVVHGPPDRSEHPPQRNACAVVAAAVRPCHLQRPRRPASSSVAAASSSSSTSSTTTTLCLLHLSWQHMQLVEGWPAGGVCLAQWCTSKSSSWHATRPLHAHALCSRRRRVLGAVELQLEEEARRCVLAPPARSPVEEVVGHDHHLGLAYPRPWRPQYFVTRTDVA
jgi:hypothetical protein